MAALGGNTFLVRSKNGPYLKHTVRYEGDTPATVEFSGVNAYTAGRRTSRLAPPDAVGSPGRPKIPSRYIKNDQEAAELWERRRDARDTNVEAAWDQLTGKDRSPFTEASSSSSSPRQQQQHHYWIAAMFLNRSRNVMASVTRAKQPQGGRQIVGLFDRYVEQRVAIFAGKEAVEPLIEQLTATAELVARTLLTAADVLTAWTTVFARDISRRDWKRNTFKTNHEWFFENADASDLVTEYRSIYEEIMGVGGFHLKERSEDTRDSNAIRALVVSFLDNSIYAPDAASWYRILGDPTAMRRTGDTMDTRAPLLHTVIHHLELKALVAYLFRSEDHAEERERVTAAAREFSTDASLFSRHRQASRGGDEDPLTVDYIETILAQVHGLFFDRLWSRPELWSAQKVRLEGSEDFSDVDMARILERLRKATVPARMTAVQLHDARAALQGAKEKAEWWTNQYYAKDTVIPLATLEKTSTRRNREAAPFLKLYRRYPELLFWSAFPEGVYLRLDGYNWKESPANLGLWSYQVGPVAAWAQQKNRGLRSDDPNLQHIPIMDWEAVNELFVRASEEASRTLLRIVQLFLGDDETVLGPVEDIFEDTGTYDPVLKEFPVIPEWIRELSGAIDKAEDTLFYLKHASRADEGTRLAAFRALMFAAKAAATTYNLILANLEVTRNADGTATVVSRDHHLRSRPAYATVDPVFYRRLFQLLETYRFRIAALLNFVLTSSATTTDLSADDTYALKEALAENRSAADTSDFGRFMIASAGAA